MMQQYTVIQRRVLALGFLLLASMLSILLLEPVLDMYADNNRQIEQMRDHIHRFRHLQSVAEDNQRLLDEWQAFGSVQQYLLDGRTVGLVSASLQKLVKDIIQQANGQLISTRTVSYQEQDYLQRVGVRVKMQADIYAVQQVLHELESHVPLLRVDALFVSHIDPRRSRLRRIRGAEAAGMVEMQFNVSGYMISPGEQP